MNSPLVVVLTISTRNPSKWVIFDSETQQFWVARDDSWYTASRAQIDAVARAATQQYADMPPDTERG